MASKSKHPGDIFEWIKKVIKSCKTYDHLESALNLVDNFYIRCGKTLAAHNMRTDLYTLYNRQLKVVTKLTYENSIS